MSTDNHTPTTRLAKTKINHRHLKVREAFHSYQQNQSNPQPVGEIHLKGRWLLEAGFGINERVEVQIRDGLLVITIAPEPAPSLDGFSQLSHREQAVIKALLEEFLIKYQR